MSMVTLTLSERDIELIEVALSSAISACTDIAGDAGTDDLAKEYARALRRVQKGGD